MGKFCGQFSSVESFIDYSIKSSMIEIEGRTEARERGEAVSHHATKLSLSMSR